MLALGLIPTWREKDEAYDALDCLYGVAQAIEFDEQDVQLVAAAAQAGRVHLLRCCAGADFQPSGSCLTQVLVQLARKSSSDLSFWLEWLPKCSEALLCHFRLALKFAKANLAPCFVCLQAALLATMPALECSAQ